MMKNIMPNELQEERVLGINFTAGNLAEMAENILCINTGLCQYVVTPNVDFVVRYHKDDEFREVVDQAVIRTADGAPVVLAARMAGAKSIERVTGADLLPELCRQASIRGVKIFFLGGLEGVAEIAAQNLTAQYPGLDICGTYSPPFGFEHDKAENEKIVGLINASEADVVFVGVGSPKQEKWIYQYRGELQSKVALCTGAAFDFIAGTVIRAPSWVQRIGLEWFWRLCSEPRRLWRRYLVEDSYFVVILFKSLFSK